MKKKKEVVVEDQAEAKKEEKSKYDSIHLAAKLLNDKYKKKLLKIGSDIPKLQRVPFGFPSLDWVNGGGIPIGRIIEKLGKEHSFKTVEGLHGLRQFQKYCFNCNTPNGLDVVWKLDKNGNPEIEKCVCKNCSEPKATIQVIVDYEKTLDKEFVENFGIDLNGVLWVVPEKPSQVSNIIQTFAQNANIGLILVDSVGAFSSDAEIDKPFEENNMNKGAITLNEIMRRITAALNFNSNSTDKPSTTVYVINQSYSSIGLFVHEIPQGGRGLRHTKSISSKNRVVNEVYDDEKNLLGTHVEIHNQKNKAGIPHRKVEVFFNQDKSNDVGYCYPDLKDEYFMFALKLGVLKQKGGWYEFGDKKWQGRDKVVADMPEELIEEVKSKLYYQ